EVVMLPLGTFQFEEVEAISESQTDKAIFVDANRLNFPLVVRKWERGDYFYPFGMQGKKKLSKFFKDEKLSLPQKENCWLLCSGEEIMWVMGRRLDSRFAVDNDTNKILRISFEP
ncbi:tRNA lysidine(34) synthetase TilS, partial [Salinimicrobium oceani]